jgi:hypothetical protein
MPVTAVIDKAAFVPPFRITGPPTALGVIQLRNEFTADM